MRIAIVGSRDFNDYDFLKEKLDLFITNNPGEFIEIVSGGAKGADSLAEKYANENYFEIIIFKPEWEKHGKKAGYMRNKTIIDFSDVCFAFRINNSKGTTHSIELAQRKGIPLYVYDF